MEENKEETNDTAQHDPGVIEVNPVSIAVDEEDAAKPQAKSISASSLFSAYLVSLCAQKRPTYNSKSYSS